MSYEYSAASGRFEIPNPYRIENLAFVLAGLVAGIAGVGLLIAHRGAIVGGNVSGVKAVIVGLLLLFLALTVIAGALVQLRYFFGRGRPHDLTNLDDPAGNDPAHRAKWLKENLRQNALAYSEPQGAISGLVHQVFDTLIFAPRLVRAAAEAQCFNLLLTAAILLGLLGSYLFYPDPAVRSWIAVVLLAVLIPKLLSPIGQETTYRRARAGIGLIVVIIALPILGPPLLARIAPSLPNITGFEFPRTLLVSLFILLVAQALFFFALMQQLRARPNVNMACEQRAMNMNGNPAKLFEELERTLQSRWVETIPNRRYAVAKLPENYAAQAGSFAGEVLEETQPVPAGEPTASIVDQLTAPATRAAVALTLLGFITFIAGVTAAVRFALVPISTQNSLATVFLAVVLFFTARYCVRSAKLLWGRVDFQSLLLWVEIDGSFEEAQINIGNQLTAAMSSTKKIINVESMTLRVWAAELDTVIFYKDGARDLVGMRGRPDVARLYADHLQTFAGNIASVVAPGAAPDAERLGRIAQLQREMGQQPAAGLANQGAGLIGAAARGNTSPAAKHCSNPACGRPLAADAVFCSNCGTRA
ncbi:MAG: zinc ribbon domain-containing protein [Steroidobacteraceae bacterium]